MKPDPHGVPPTAPPQPWPSAPSGYGQPPYAGSGGYVPPTSYEQGYGAYGQPPPTSSAPGYGPAGSTGQPFGQSVPPPSTAGYGQPPPPAGGPQGYGQPPPAGPPYTQASAPPYGQPPPPAAPAPTGYAQAPTQYGYGQIPPSQPGYSQQQSWQQQQSYGAPQPGYQSYGPQQGTGYGYGVAELFPPGTDPEVIRMFQQADRDGSGQVDDVELQKVLSSAAHSFSIRTVHLLILSFSVTSSPKIKPPEFASLWKSLRDWRKIFDTHDRDRSGRMDCQELQKALLSIGCQVSNPVLKIIVSRYDRSGQGKSIDYDNFIECALLVKGLTDKFKEKDVRFQGSATLTYEEFMLMVLPFLVA